MWKNSLPPSHISQSCHLLFHIIIKGIPSLSSFNLSFLIHIIMKGIPSLSSFDLSFLIYSILLLHRWICKQQQSTMATNNYAADAEVEPTSPADLSTSTRSSYAKGRGKAFTSNNTLILVRAYMDISADTAKGTNRASDTYWQQIENNFNELPARSNSINERVEGKHTD